MLTGFYKNNADNECQCQVVKFSDRIWFDEAGTASFLRTFVLRVLDTSPIPLSEVTMLVPAKKLLNVSNMNDTCFDDEYFFNSSFLRTTSSYKIIEKPKTGSYGSYGLIEDDGIKNIIVFVGEESQPKVTQVGRCNLVRFKFPRPINHGEHIELRLSFKVASLFDNLTPDDLVPEFSFMLVYFSRSCSEEIMIIGNHNEIDIVPTLGGPDNKGGFDVWVYLPNNFIMVSGFDEASRKPSRRTIDGKEEGESKFKIGWKLRHLLRRLGLPPTTLVNNGLGSVFELTGQIKKRYDSVFDLKKLCNSTDKIPYIDDKIHVLKKEAKLSRILAIIAIIFAILIPIGIEIYKYCFPCTPPSP